MLEIKNISKVYETGGFKQKALDKVSISFRNKEFVSILGPSGSGKTTLLNIIGGLDSYTNGDLLIDNISTKKYKDRAWDTYRNNKVGFVFQNYNLIFHQTVLKNVELALTLSGISKEERRKRAKEALENVGLLDHINKKPNQLSGGQMQRVAIARALVNNPEIILADEPTGALDSDTSIDVMNVLKKISKDKLVIMVTHNPDLAKEYSTRIINIKDGKIESDSNPYNGRKKEKETSKKDNNKTKMSFLTALSLSFNNLMTKKARTLLVSLAGSIGIIGIALILAVSTGFQNYVDSIEKSTLTSYPLTIYEKSSDALGILLKMQNDKGKSEGKGKVKEKQYITSMLSSVSNNDLKSFKNYLDENKYINKDLTNTVYSYNISPNIYTIDVKNKLAKVNPSDIFSNMMGGSALSANYSSIYSEMMPEPEDIKDDYKMLKGRWPKKYNEMIIVLSDENSISDLLVYSLGLREVDELNNMVTKIMSGETVKVNNKAKTFTYDELMNVDLRLVYSSDTYKYNSKYNLYEDMSDNDKYMNNLYKNGEKLKIVGVVTQKKGTNTNALNPGIVYTKDLTHHIIDYSKDTEIVKKQLDNEKINVFTGKKFTDKNDFDLGFEDMVKVDNERLKSIFNIDIDSNAIEKETKKYMNDINNSISVDYSTEKDLFNKNLKDFSNDLLSKSYNKKDIDTLVDDYLDSYDASKKLSSMEREYIIPKDVYKKAYSGLLKGLLTSYAEGYSTYMSMIDPSYDSNSDVKIEDSIKDKVLKTYLDSAPIKEVGEKIGKTMHEAVVKKEVLTKVGELTKYLSETFAKAFNIDPEDISSCFTLNFNEDEMKRVFSALMNDEEKTLNNNLSILGYQDLNNPSAISFYFKSFESKEHFIKFIDNYNKSVVKDKKLNYTDMSGILMSSVKTIVNAVSYVLIAFVSISLVVSSIMIGVITYISVYERTKEIGILRAIGASKRNISEVFNAETFIIGLLSGLLGIGISYSIIPIINFILHSKITDIVISACLKPNHALILVLLSVLLTIIGGLIPAKKASRKDPVEALRSE